MLWNLAPVLDLEKDFLLMSLYGNNLLVNHLHVGEAYLLGMGFKEDSIDSWTEKDRGNKHLA